MKIIPKPKIVTKKSAGVKKADKYYAEKGLSGASRKKYYKVKVKATDPGARAGSAKSIKMTEITEKKAQKLEAKNPRKDVENPGKLAQNVTKQTGLDNLDRYKGSKVANAKSNLNLKGKGLSVVVGKSKVGQMEAKKPGNQFEKGTTGKQLYVGTQEPKAPEIKKIQPKTIQKTTAQTGEKLTPTPISYSGRTEETAENKPAQVKKATTSSVGTKKTPAAASAGTLKMTTGAKKAASKKYFVNVGGQEKQVTEDEAKGRYKGFFNK